MVEFPFFFLLFGIHSFILIFQSPSFVHYRYIKHRCKNIILLLSIFIDRRNSLMSCLDSLETRHKKKQWNESMCLCIKVVENNIIFKMVLNINQGAGEWKNSLSNLKCIFLPKSDLFWQFLIFELLPSCNEEMLLLFLTFYLKTKERQYYNNTYVLFFCRKGHNLFMLSRNCNAILAKNG